MKDKGYMHCLTGNDINGDDVEMNIYGPDETSEHRRVEFLFRPCVPSQIGTNNGVCEANLTGR